jgi:hypothetical protein
MLLLIDRGKRILRAALRDNLHIKRARGSGDAEAGENALVDVGEFNERGLLGDEEDVFFEHEEVALDRLEVGFDTRVAVTAVLSISSALTFLCISLRREAKGEPLETTGANDFLLGQRAKYARNDFKCRVLVIFPQPFVLCYLLPVERSLTARQGQIEHTHSVIFSSAVISSSRLNCMTKY